MYSLEPNFRGIASVIRGSFNDANMILASVQNPDINLLNEILGLITVTENEKSILKYNFYYNRVDYQNARLNMNCFNPGNTDETDYKSLRL